MSIAYTVVYTVLATAAAVFVSLLFVHMLQLESYQGLMYLRWVSKHIGDEVFPITAASLVALMLRFGYAMLMYTYPVVSDISYYLADALYVLMLAVMAYSAMKKKNIKPLVYTGRIKRLLAVITVLVAVCSCSFFQPTKLFLEQSFGVFLFNNILRYLPGIMLPFFVFAAYLITYPIEESVKKWYFNDARRKLEADKKLIRIAITGSFGKTGTKYALKTLLSKQYNTLCTPGSYNTPMGVTRVVREQLNDEHEVFIAEMGARYKGDIKELCKLVRPQYGILTAIGKQHLETFGSLENIIRTKCELVDALSPDGCCFFNGDSLELRAAYSMATIEEKYLFGTEGDGLYMKASDITVSCEGSEFTLTASDGKSIVCHTQLLGKHNIVNLTGAAACAYRLGVDLDKIAEGISEAEPVEHRLQLKKGTINIIDDAFNSNPVGSKEALNVLSRFSGKRIIVTPGMVELGEEEDELNKAFGVHMASCVDIAIVIGKKHADPICEGLLKGGFNSESLVRVETLDEASLKLPQYTEPGCVVLFENDLPDNYKE